jgi:uncharacterized protein YdhG (YjbR/CyaY superfamily)
MAAPHPISTDAYIKSFPKQVQVLLQQMRSIIQAAAPKATEAIKYAMPCFLQEGILVCYAGYKSHIGFYPAPTGDKSFEKALSVYKTGRGSVQFPLDKPLPKTLITRMVKHQLIRNKEKAIAKAAKK